MTLAELLDARPHVLLDFDGPICAVFSGMGATTAALRLHQTLAAQAVPIPADAVDGSDPFELLRAAAHAGADYARVAEAALRVVEVEAVRTAPATPGLIEMLDALTSSGHTVTIVSNNSAEAVHTVVTAHCLDRYITAIVARTEPDPDLLKPSPHLVNLAMRRISAQPAQCILIGDSGTDITAAHTAGIPCIGYANTPDKSQRLADELADAIVTDLADIATAAHTLHR